jgi:hypothetical protein
VADDGGGDTTSTDPAADAGSRLDLLLGALRRFTLLFVGIGATTVVLSLAFGALAHAGLQRSIAVGLYLIGSLVLVFGFFVGNRGPLRRDRDDDEKLSIIPRGTPRKATPEERRESINLSFLFIVIGFGLIILGALSDSAHKLF